MMPCGRHPENVSPYTGLRVPVCKGTYTQEGGGLMLQGYTMAIVPCGNRTPKKLPTGGGEWPTFHTARARRTVRPREAKGLGTGPARAPHPPEKKLLLKNLLLLLVWHFLVRLSVFAPRREACATSPHPFPMRTRGTIDSAIDSTGGARQHTVVGPGGRIAAAALT